MQIKKIGLILPDHDDYLANTVFDGLKILAGEGKLQFFVNNSNNSLARKNKKYISENIKGHLENADLIILCLSGRSIRNDLIINDDWWQKTVILDGREAGKQKMIENNFYSSVEPRADLLSKCKLYFKREAPYGGKVLALPFGIESKYQKWNKNIKKDIDFTCVFGQEICPPTRKQIREIVQNFCQKNNLKCFTKSTRSFLWGPYSKFARNKFWKILARTKVSVSIRGAGMDTVRFWESLGNNCGLLTDNVGIFENPRQALGFSRIIEFGEPSELDKFKLKLKEILETLRKEPNYFNKDEEFNQILKEHSSRNRVLFILNKTGIIR